MSEPEFCVVLKREHVLSEEIYTTRAKNFTLPTAVTGMTNFTSDHTIGGNGGAAARLGLSNLPLPPYHWILQLLEWTHTVGA